MELISLKEARAQGLKRYFTGKPCKYGHVAERYVTRRGCVQCSAEHGATYRDKNPKRVRACRANYYAANKERELARVKEYQVKNKEQVLASARDWKAKNQESVSAYNVKYYAENRERLRSCYREWARENPANVRANVASRKAMKLQQRCGCCTNQQFEDEFYAWNGGGPEVDHVIALKLGGPHCTKNLRLLTAVEHKAKTGADRRKMACVRTRTRLLTAWHTPALNIPTEGPTPWAC